MTDSKNKSNATSAGEGTMDASVGSGGSVPENSARADTSEDGLTPDSWRGESTNVVGMTPTTAEEAMDNAEAEDGFVDESAYAPTPTDRS